MKKLSWLLNTLIVTMSAAVVGGTGHFIAQRIIDKPLKPIIQEESYTIVIPDSFELLSDRQLALSPWLVDSQDNYVEGRFEYILGENAASYIAVDKNGIVSVIQPTDELLTITIHERQKENVEDKTVNIKVIAELSEVHEIRDAQGKVLSSEVVMEIGESYTFDVVTMPMVTAVQEYLTFTSVDGDATAKDVFDISVSNNKITLTAVGFGEGEMNFSLKNANRGLDYSLAVPFKIQFPDATFNEAVAEATESELLSPEELGSIQRLVFDEDETQFSIEKYEYLTGLKTMVFTAKELVSVTGATLRKDLIFRVPAEAPENVETGEYGLALYSSYLNDATWGEYAATTYPYLDDYKKSVVVYHNEDTYSYQGKVFNGVSIEEQSLEEYTYIDEQTAPALKAVNVEVGEVETYTLTGYDFVGWKDLLGMRFESEDLPLVQEGVHVLANWTAKQYNVTLHGWYADATQNDTVTVSYHQGLPTLADGVKQSWTFEGWYLSDEYLETEKVQAGIIYNSLDDLTLYAKYTATVIRNDCGLGLDLAPIENVVYGKPIGNALNFTEDQLNVIATTKWTFEGWNESFDYTVDGEMTTGKVYVREGNPADGFSHTLHAKLTRQITFDTLGMSNDTMQPLTIIKGQTAQKSMGIYGLTEEDLTITAKTEGWTFKGWTFVPFIDYVFDNYGFAHDLNGPQLVFDITKEFHIDYEIAYPMYETDITFEYAPKGDQTFVQQVYFGTRISMPDTEDAKDLPNWTEFDGYDFVNWYYANQNVTAPNEEFIDESFANKVYEAKYRAKVYTIYFHGEDGSDVGYTRYTDVGYDIEDNVLNNDENSYNCPGRTISVVAVPDKVGKTGYWNWAEKDLDLEVGATTWTVPDGFYGDLVFKAVYVNNTYTITLNTYGVMETTTMTVKYDNEFVLPIPEKMPEGYTFSCWTDTNDDKGKIYNPGQADKYLIADDIELFACYFINVTYQGFNRTNVVPHRYGIQVKVDLPIDKAEAQGWTFAGWYSKDAEGNETDLTYDDEQQYLINGYTSAITQYYSRWTREVLLDVGEGFGLENDKIIVERNKSLKDLGIKLPTDEEISKETDDAEKWTLISWHSALDANETITETTVFNDRNKDLKELKAKYQSKIAIEIEYKSKMFDTVTGNESITLGDSGWLAKLDSWFSDELKRDEDNGYEHHGWSVNGKEYLLNGNGEYDEGVDIVGISFGDNTIKAVFRSYGYYIEFDANGGSPTPAEMWLQIDQMVTLPAAIERKGYSFGGWKIDDQQYAAGETIEPLTTENEKRFVAKAVWIPIQYKVVFDVNGGVELPENEAEITVTCEDWFAMPTTTRVGYILEGWWLIGGDGSLIECNKKERINLDLVKEVVTYRAKWTPITYSVNYELDGGDMEGDWFGSATYDDKDGFTFASGATKEWYHFVGWNVNGTLYTAGQTVENLTADPTPLTAIAVWEATEYELRYRESKDSDKVLAKVVFTIESKSYIQPIAPILDAEHANGYEASWDFSKLPLYNKEARETDFIEGVDVCPIYTPISYTVNYLDGNGKVVYSLPYTYENILNVFDENGNFKTIDGTSLKDVQMDGYTFAGWEALNWSGTTFDWHIKDKSLQAIYTPIQYTVNFKDETGKTLAARKVTMETVAVDLPVVPEKSGYMGMWNFSRDIFVEAVKGLENGKTTIDVSAIYTPIVYKVTLQTAEKDYEYAYTVETAKREGSKYTLSVLAPTLCENGEILIADENCDVLYSAEARTLTLTFSTLGNIVITEEAEKVVDEETYQVVFDYGYDGIAVHEIYKKGEGITLPDVQRDGYKLAYWVNTRTEIIVENGDVLSENGNESFTIVAHWDIASYTIYYENAGTMAEVNVAYEDIITLPSTEKLGYTLAGWSFGDKVFLPGENVKNLSSIHDDIVTLTAVWRANQYNVQYNALGGEETPVTQTAAYDTPFYLANIINKEGYIFQGWMQEGKEGLYEGGERVVSLTNVDGGIVTLTAVWKAIEYTVVFANSEQPNATYTYDKAEYFPEPPAREGYVFTEWTYTLYGEKKSVAKVALHTKEICNLTSIQGDVVIVTAHWSVDKEEVTYRVSEDVTYTRNVSIESPFIDEPLKPITEATTATTVAGWALSEEVNTYVIIVGAISEGYVTVTYTYNGMNAYRIYQNYAEGADLSAIEPTLPQKEGYTAVWKYTQDPETGAVTAVAEYVLTNTETYTLVFDTQGGPIVEKMTIRFDAERIELPSTERRGYNFCGWYFNGVKYVPGMSTNFNTEQLPEITLTASWELISYTISFNGLSDEHNVSYTVEMDRAAILAKFPNAAETIIPKTGYVAEWKLPINQLGDMTLSPVYTPITYTVQYDMQGAVEPFASVTVAYNDGFILGVPSKAGYTFVGWRYDYQLYSGSETTKMNLCSKEGETITLVAVWDAVKDASYTATFVADGNVIQEVTFTKADVEKGYIIAPNVPEKVHYLATWATYKLEEIDFTVEAEYIPVVYAIAYISNGETVFTAYYTVEEKNTLIPADPTKVGYIFQGWTEITQDGGNKTTEALFDPIQYKVQFANATLETKEYTYDESYEVLAPQDRAGYTFRRWALTVGETTYYYKEGDTICNLTAENGATITLTAEWTANQYEITLEGASRAILYTVDDDIDAINNQIANVTEIPQRVGYTAAWETLTELKPGGMIVHPVYTPIEYFVLFFDESGNRKGERIWTVESGSIREPSIADGFVWKLANGQDYVLAVESFSYNEETQRFEMVVVATQNFAPYKVQFIQYDPRIGEDLVYVTKYYNIVEGQETVMSIPECPKIVGYHGEWDYSALSSYISQGFIIYDAQAQTVTIKSPEGMDLQIKTKYTPIHYVIHFDENGDGEINEEEKTSEVEFAQKQITLTTPTRVGYVFSGWKFGEEIITETTIKKDFASVEGAVVTLTAVWTPIEYTVNYIVLGEGVVTETPASQTVKFDELFSLAAAPVRAYYDFAGWKLQGSEIGKDGLYGAEQEVSMLTAIAGGEVALTAEWTPKKYTATFVANGEVVGTVEFDSESTHIDLTKVEVPGVEHYIGKWDENFVLNKADITIYAVYTPIEYAVIYLNEDGSIYHNETKYTVEDTTVVNPSVPEKAGYAGEWETFTLKGGDITVHPKYTAITYVITFYNKAQGEENLRIVAEETYTIEAVTISLPAVPAGYVAWDMPTLKKGESYGDLSVYPIASASEGTVVTFEDETGKVLASIVVTDRLENLPKVPEKAGYEGEWTILSSNEGKVTMRPIYTPTVYTVTFYDKDGQVYATTTYTVADHDIEVPAVPERAENAQHYDAAWAIPELTIGNVDVYPTYTPKIYTVYFYSEQTDIGDPSKTPWATRVYTIESRDIDVPETPTKVGYKNVVWSDYNLKELKDLCDLHVYAIYTNVKYTVEYRIEGGPSSKPAAPASIEVVYDQKFTLATYATPTGYLDDGWKDVNGTKYEFATEQVNMTTVDGDKIILTLTLTPIRYVVRYLIEGGPLDKNEAPNETPGTYDRDIVLATYQVPLGYNYDGWLDDKGNKYELGSTQLNLTNKNTENVFLTLKLSPIQYTIEYYARNGSKVATQNATYDEYITAPGATTETGYDFNYWEYSYGPSTMRFNAGAGIKNLTFEHGAVAKVYAITQLKKYKVTYSASNVSLSVTVNGTKLDSGSTVQHGTVVTITHTANQNYENPKCEYCSGTSSAHTITVTGALTITAKATIKYYKIEMSGTNVSLTVTVNGKTISSGTSVAHGSSITITHTANTNYQNPSCNLCTNGNSHPTTVTGPLTISASATKIPEDKDDDCLAEGTLITLADGSKSAVENLRRGDYVMAFDHITGKVTNNQIIAVVKIQSDFYKNTFVFDDGSMLVTINEHGIYDLNLRKYVNIDEINYMDYIGHDFVSIDTKGNIGTKKLVDVISEWTTGYKYDIVTEQTLNYVAEDTLSVTHVLVDVSNIFEFDENMCYNQEKMVADIEKYGLYTYEDFAEYVPYEVYKVFPAPYFKVAVGKGLVTFEELLGLIEKYCVFLGI